MSVTASLAETLPAEALDGNGDRWPWIVGTPEAVIHPASTEEVAATMRWAAGRAVGVAVVASGRRFLGARRLDRPFVILCTDRLTGVEIYEPADLTLTAKAGTPLTSLASTLGAHRQWLPFDPPHVDTRSLGGLVAAGDSGPLWMGFGELRNHILGSTVVTGDGRVVRLGGRVVKNVAGFDLLKPMIGSRGRLAVLTSVCVRAFPVPPVDRLLALRADSASALLPVARAVGTAPFLPVSSVLVSPAPLGATAALLVRLHGAEPTVEADQRTLERHCGVSFERAADVRTVAALARDHAADGELVLGVSTLPSRLPEVIVAMRETVGDVPLAIDTYRGAVRAVLSADQFQDVARLRARVEALGGALSARSTRRDVDASALSSAPSKAAGEITARLERVFDSSSVLWPSRA
ncbi:MAG: FAD-binding protein [Gemmatimonadetes bacterium]|nr:FAD-binding protein [Gemmatimonadota bacterium]